MGDLSTTLVYGAMAAYMVSMIAFAVDVSALGSRRGDALVSGERVRRAAGIAMSTLWLGAGLHLIGIVTRGLAAGRAPWANMYEFTLMFTFMLVAIFLGIQFRRDVRYLGALVTLLSLLGLGLAVSVLFVAADGVQPALNSYWLIIHVSVATISTGLLSLAALFSIFQLIKHRAEGGAGSLVDEAAGDGPEGEEGGSGERASSAVSMPDGGARPGAVTAVRAAVLERTPGTTALSRILSVVPPAITLERIAYRLNAIGFVTWTFTLVAGAIWAQHAWGEPWSWDPKETWTFVIWVIYAAYLHARVTAGWTAEKFAYFSLVGFVALLANFYIVNLFFSGDHSYSGI